MIPDMYRKGYRIGLDEIGDVQRHLLDLHKERKSIKEKIRYGSRTHRNNATGTILAKTSPKPPNHYTSRCGAKATSPPYQLHLEDSYTWVL